MPLMNALTGSISRLMCVGVIGLWGVATPLEAVVQLEGTERGEWRYLGGDAGHTRSSHLDQINRENFSDLRVAWWWRGDNFGPIPEFTFRSTPVFVDGTLYTVAGMNRQVVAVDAATGETLWTFREPETIRHLRSPRAEFGKGVAYGEIDGRGVIYVTSPGFFLWALDAKSGRPLEGWGRGVEIEGFPGSGVVDLIPDLIEGWEPWEDWAGDPYDPDYGIPRELGMITSSAPPIVVNGVVVVLNGHEPSYYQTRIENVPGDIMGYDATTGEHLWTFHVIPRPGEVGHDTWENEAWRWSGDMSSWVPAAADPELGLVYIVTNASTVESYTGHRPGDNLFGGSVLALEVATGERRWHYQIHRSEQWNYDIPATPILMDLQMDGEVVPALVQNTKLGLIFAFNRLTGEPIWPIEDRPVIQTQVPGNYTSPTQPFPTRPEPLDPIVLTGLTEEFVIDYTPEVKARALEILEDYRVAGLYVPRLPYDHDNDFLNYVTCSGRPSVVNIYHPPVADPTTGILYASHTRGCSTPSFMVPTGGVDQDNPDFAELGTDDWRGRDRRTPTTGTTVADWLPRGGGGLPRIEGLPIWKPQDQMLSAFDMNTGERLWMVPIGDTPPEIRDHPLLAGVDIPNTGGTSHSIQMVLGDVVVQTTEDLRGPAELSESGMPLLHARNKLTGEILASVEIPVPGQYGMMTYMHEGRQYIVLQVGSARRGVPGGLLALTLP